MNWYGLEISAENFVQTGLYLALIVAIAHFLFPVEWGDWARLIREQFREADTYIKVGVWGTLAVFAFVFLVSGFDHCVSGNNCTNKVARLLAASPNEVGDSLAGLAGTLAFLWIIVTVLLQSKELGAQKEEMRLDRVESAKMAIALEAQAEVFRDEQKHRQEDRNKQFLDEQLKLIVEKTYFYRNSVRVILRLKGSEVETKEGFIEERNNDKYIVTLFGRDKLDGTADEALLSLSMKLSPIEDLLDDLPENHEVVWVPNNKNRLDEILDDFEEIEKIVSLLSGSQKSRLKRMRFSRTLMILRSFKAAPFWKGEQL